MSTPVLVYLLTALAAVVVGLTRLRLARTGAAGGVPVERRLLDAHTVTGVLAVGTWLAFLVAADDTVLGSAGMGIVAIGCWWTLALLGLVLLVRSVPAGRRSATPETRTPWSQGPGLAVLAHVGLLVGVVVFTWAYLTTAV